MRGSTTIIELLAELNVPCAQCGGAFHEPLTLAARRHRRDPGAFLRACQALDEGGPTAEQIAAARARVS